MEKPAYCTCQKYISRHYGVDVKCGPGPVSGWCKSWSRSLTVLQSGNPGVKFTPHIHCLSPVRVAPQPLCSILLLKGFAESDSSSTMYTTGRLHTRVTESASQWDIYIYIYIHTEAVKGSLAEPLGFFQLESWWAYEPHIRGSLLQWFHLQLSILLCGAANHIEFLLAGWKAVLMNFTIATRSHYTRGPMT